MKRKMFGGLTSASFPLFIQNTSSSVGAGLSGLVFNTAGLVAEYRRQGQSAWTAITLVTTTLGTWTSGGFIVDGSLVGGYELQIPDAVIAAGVRWVAVRLYGAANMLQCLLELEIDAVNYQSANAFVTGVNGLAPPTNWNLQSIDASGRVDVGKVGGTAQTARDLGASVLLSSGTGAGQLSLAAGLVSLSSPQAFNNTGQTTKQAATLATADVTGNLPANVAQIAGQTATAAAGVTFPASIGTSTFAAGQNVGAAASVTAGVTVTTNNDKSGYSLVSPQAFNNTGQTTKNAVTLAAADVTGNLPANTQQFLSQAVVLDANNIPNVNAKDWAATAITTAVPNTAASVLTAGEHTAIQTDVTTGLTTQGYTTVRAGYLDTLSGLVAAVWAAATRTLTAFGFSVTVGTDSAAQTATQTAVTAIKLQTDKIALNTMDSPNTVTAQATIAGLVAAVWAAATRTLTAFGFSVTVGTDSAAQTATQTAVTAIKAKTDLIATNAGDSPNAVTAQAAATTIAANVLLLLGINGQFQGCRNFVYSGTNLTSYDICIYSSNANATTNDGVTGLLHKFSAALTYNGSNLQITQVITQIS